MGGNKKIVYDEGVKGPTLPTQFIGITARIRMVRVSVVGLHARFLSLLCIVRLSLVFFVGSSKTRNRAYSI